MSSVVYEVRLRADRRGFESGAVIATHEHAGDFKEWWARLLSSRAIALGLEVMAIGPFADTDSRLQSIVACKSEVNTTIYPAHCRFLRCVEAG